jgi:hypothetical protein
VPKKLERSLKRTMATKPWPQERKDAYVYGTMRKMGWEPSHQKRAHATMRRMMKKG